MFIVVVAVQTSFNTVILCANTWLNNINSFHDIKFFCIKTCSMSPCRKYKNDKLVEAVDATFESWRNFLNFNFKEGQNEKKVELGFEPLLGAIQIIRDTFSARFRPPAPPPHVTLFINLY